MNIKKLISNQKARHHILRTLSWVPDRLMLSLQYRFALGRWPNLRNPQRFSERIQWYKMNIHDPLMAQCVDKYRVREYITNVIGGGYLTHLYSVTYTAKEINFDNLPQKFVMKTTDGGNGDNVLICKSKDNLDKERATTQVDSWRNKRYYSVSREWAYVGARDSRIIVEELLEDDSNPDGSVDDYKFLCFHGRFRLLWVDKGRFSDHRRGFWNENLNFLDKVASDHPTFDEPPKLPDNIQEMISLAEKLSQPFLFARIDLYNIHGRIVFGEITFYPWSGYVKFMPDDFDFRLGSFFES